MKTRFVSSIRLPLLAGALALAVTGCGSMNDSMHRSSDRSIAPAGYSSSSGIPPSIDPFSSRYVSFPVSANESAGISGHSFFCVQHYNQPGCQSLDAARDNGSMSNRSARYNRGNWRDTSPTDAQGNSIGEVSPGRY